MRRAARRGIGQQSAKLRIPGISGTIPVMMMSNRTWQQPLRRLTDLGLRLAAIAILAVMVLRATVSIDSSHDTWWYHLPWAARLAGLLPADTYVLGDFLEHRYAGFPVLWEWLQGWIWRLTGRPEAVNLLSLGSLLIFVGHLYARFRVPAHLAFLALVAIPLVQIEATIAYADLTANLALTSALLLLPPLYSPDPGHRRSDLAVFFIACALAANLKLQLIPVTGVVYLVGLIAAIRAWRRETGGRGHSWGQTITAVLAVTLISAVIFYVPSRNLLSFGNPFYPLAVKVGPLVFDGPEGPPTLKAPDRQRMLVEARGRMPRGPAHPTAPAPEPASARPAPPPAHISAIGTPTPWLQSVLEIGMEPLLGRGIWSLAGEQDPPLPSHHGGYFGWYVVVNLLLLAFLVSRRRREHPGVLALFAATTLVTAFLPSHQILRYYLYWMLVLVSLNLMLLRPRPPLPASSAGTDLQRLFGSVALLALLLVVYATRAELIQPRFYFVEDLIEVRRDPTVLAAVEQNAPTCLAGERPPRYFLYSQLFNPGKTYRLKMGPPAGHSIDAVPRVCAGWNPVVATGEDTGLLPARPNGANRSP